MNLSLSDNAKVKFQPNHYNTFGLSYGLPKNGGTCPGATSGAGGCLAVRDGLRRPTCYMAKITQIYKGVQNTLDLNTKLLRKKSYSGMKNVLISTFKEFYSRNEKSSLYFRLLYSGDVFSETFAKAIRDSCKAFPSIQFWVYTRSHKFVNILSQANNLAVYISVDPVNYKNGVRVYKQLKKRKNVGLAFMGNVTDEDIKFVRCPETSGVIKNTPERGACSKCRLCFTYNENIKLRNIQFKIH